MIDVTAAFAVVGGLFLCEWAFAAWRRNIEAAILLRDLFFASAETLVRDPDNFRINRRAARSLRQYHHPRGGRPSGDPPRARQSAAGCHGRRT